MLSQPKIVVFTKDYRRLHALLEALPRSTNNHLLMDELERAELVDAGKLPANVVSMHSRVTFTVLSTRKTFTYRLVYPHEATTNDTLSILNPVGSALLGLGIGQKIEWPLEGNKSTLVRIDVIPRY